MHISEFSLINRTRSESPEGFKHPMNAWSISDWFLAVTGELGEAANVAKKLNRYRDGIPGNKQSERDLKLQLADEIADTYIYLDLLAQRIGVDLELAVVKKFNDKSREIGYPHLIKA